MTDLLTNAIVAITENSIENDRALLNLCTVMAEEVQKLQIQVNELQGIVHNVIMHESLMERRLDSLLTMFLTNTRTTDG